MGVDVIRGIRNARAWRNGGIKFRPIKPSGMGAEAIIAAVEHFPDPIMISGRSGEVYYANPAYLALCGAGPGTFPLPGLAALVRGCGAQTEILYRLQKAALDGLTAEDTLMIGEGETRREFDVRAARLANGQAALCWSLRARPPIKKEPAEARTYTSNIFDALNRAPLSFAIIDHNGALVFANLGFARCAGQDQQEILRQRQPASELLEGGPWPWEPESRLPDTGVCRAVLRSIEGDHTPYVMIYRRVKRKKGPGQQTYFLLLDPGNQGLLEQAFTGDAGTRFLRLFDIAPVGIVIVDQQTRILEVNGSFRQRFNTGVAPGDNFLELISPDSRNEAGRIIREALHDGALNTQGDVQIGTGQGARTAQLFAAQLSTGEGGASAVLYLADITEQKNLELQFSQSQKMQAVGQLAGGVAHDFNNLLTAILGYCDLLLDRHSAGDPSFSDIHQIKQNASRAANLVRQLLAFSRQQTLKPTVISLTDMLAELNNLLRRLLGDKVSLTMNHGRNLGAVRADQGQLETVIINLAVNARDAMGPGGGAIVIRTENITASEARALDYAWMPPGDCVMIEVADTGPGIPKEIIGKIFEPFFTTKEVGKGTGLGLSTAYGIVKQQGGNIYVASEPPGGAVFRIYLPRYEPLDAEAPNQTRNPEVKEDLTGNGIILLVEDEEPVRAFASRALAGKGYTVLEATGGEQALEIMRSHKGSIDLVISDVMMPNMDGASLLKEIRAIDPVIRVIFVSGYAEEAFRNNDEPLGDFTFLPKPFTLRQLAARVKEVLG